MNRRSQATILNLLRTQLGTWPEEIPHGQWMDPHTLETLRRDPGFQVSLNELLGKVRQLRELFVGMANGPFLLVMKADDPIRFVEFAEHNPSHNIRISFEQKAQDIGVGIENLEVETVIRPVEEPGAYTLSFGLPRILEEHLLFDEGRGIRLAPGMKKRFFSEITVYRHTEERDWIFRLTYDPETVRNFRRGVRR